MTRRKHMSTGTKIAWAVAVVAAATMPAAADERNAPAARWAFGPPRRADYFPIAVWLQAPKNAAKFKAVGINMYVGLWKGPTEKQLADLKAAGMPVICHQNAVGLKHRKDPIIVGWMHGDEPDNAQSRGRGKGYGPPILPEKIVADYKKIRAADPTRPVILNLGQGVAWDGWIGRGVRTNHPEDYPEYVKGCNIASFDIYPAVHRRPQVAGKLWYVARGVDRLIGWAGPGRTVWNCIECTRISNTKVKPTGHQVRAEVWMSIIHGSRGLIYFVHQFKPRFIEAGLLADREMTAAVTNINAQVRALAPVINSHTAPARVVAGNSSAADSPLACMARTHGDAAYVFVVTMRDRPATATITISGVKTATAEVIGENRTIRVTAGTFTDTFKGYDVHLYKVRSSAAREGTNK